MTRTSLKSRLAGGKPLLGSWLSWGFPPVAELMARSGFDFLVVDQEHGAIGVAEMHQLVQVIDLAGLPPIVRVAGNETVLIKQALDAGAEGVIVPMVNSVEEAKQAVARAHYPPKGIRGAGLARAQGYGLGFAEYQARAKETVVFVQIEHIDAVRQIDAILAVDGVDGFVVGPYDLSASLGHAGDWAHPDVKAALDIIARTVQGTKKVAGYHVVHSDAAELKARFEAGYRFVAYGDDMVFLAEKVRDELAAARKLLGAGR